MLFERKPLWSDPKVDNPNPFLDVIIYNNDDGSKVVIGGTNPDSLFFTSANCKYELHDVQNQFFTITAVLNIGFFLHRRNFKYSYSF